MAAAVADFRPPAAAAGKLERARAAVDAAARADGRTSSPRSRRRAGPGQVLVGFAAETDDGLARARQKRERKGVDLVVLNDVSRTDIGFEVDHNEVTSSRADGVRARTEGLEARGGGGDPRPRRSAARRFDLC